MSRAGKGNGPAVQRGAVQGVNAEDNADEPRQSPVVVCGPHLLGDSRSRVMAAIRAAEQRDAPLFRITVQRVAQLRHIARTKYAHRDRMVAALLTGELTAADAFDYLDTQQPHARLCALREEGLPILDRWVLVPTANGHTRRVKAYRMAAKDAA